ncbi:MAG: carbon-nitrogen hydrolase family protein [Actinobacteria bacterium]|nr:carbon-nitrogen hydrolase family protein [Actinomycetota bacterium]
MIQGPVNIAACAIQLGLIRPDDLRTELKKEIRFIKDNIDGDVDLLVFPEYHGLLLQLLAAGSDPRTTEVSEILNSNLQKKMEDIFSFYSEIAVSLTTNVVTGSYLLEEKDGRYLSVGVFDRDGNFMGYQNKTHTSDFDSYLEVSRGLDLRVIGCDAGRIGVMMGEDRFIPEVSRDLSLRGVNIFASPCSTNIQLNVFQQACGLWKQVQSEQVYGIESYLVGTLLGSTYQGSSAIIFPVEISHDRSGFQRISNNVGRSLVIREELDFAKLQRNIESYPIYSNLNFDLYRTKLRGAYEKLKKFGEQD